jgi:hypothetical protein
MNGARARAAVAVVQIADRAIERERFLDFPPVELVLRDLVRRASGNRRARRFHLAKPIAGDDEC